MKNIYYTTFGFLLFSFISFGQINVNTNLDDNALIQTLGGAGVTISNVSVNGVVNSYGQFTNGGAGFDQGVLLTSGNILNAVGPNDLTNAGTDNFSGGSTLLDNLGLGTTQDACEISFDIIPEGCEINFNYIFGSEEYHEWVNSAFNDVFGFFISGPGIQGNQNIALIPNTTTPVAINTVNNGFSLDCPVGNTSLFLDNCGGPVVQYDGFTRIFQAQANGLTPGATYRITLAIADVLDGTFDSGVLIQQGSFSSLSPAFVVDNYECNEDGTYNVTVTATDVNSPNQWWRLRETTQQGETQGGVNIGDIQNGVTTTFFNLDRDKFYYISHGVWDECVSFTTDELALDPDFLSPAFEIDNYECNNEDGTYNVTVTAAAVNSPNQWWRLRETTQQGETQGGVNIGDIQNGATTTFFNLDPDKFYYISHGVWSTCVSFKTEELALDFSPSLSPAFVINNAVCTSEENGTYNVTVTATDISSPNHWWRLRETTQYGETQGGTNVGGIQNGATTTFINLDSDKFYYISHGVWSGCVPFTTDELALDSPCIGFIIKEHDCPSILKNELDMSDITSVDEGLVDKACHPCEQGYADVYLADSNGDLIDASIYDNILWSNGDTTIESKAFPEEPISVVVTYKIGNYERISEANFLLECDFTSLDDPRGNDPKNLRKTADVEISPNPNKGEMNINVKLENDFNISLNIYRFDGQLVRTLQNLKTTNGVFNMNFQSKLPAGLYFFNFSINKETIIKKVIIE